MNNKLLVGLITGGAIASTVASVYAFSSNNVDSVKSALANNDYSAWQTAITDSPNADELSTIDESTFAQLVEAYNLAQNGDFDSAKTIIDELDIHGLGMIIGMGGGHGPHGGDGGMFGQGNTAVDEALTNNDYSAWQTAIADNHNSQEMLSAINESNFSQLVEAHNLMKQARTIMDGLGLGYKGNRNNSSSNS
ncbi:MAG TPA: hypothetical protein PLH65_02915 [bacterium]|nr:hypothetical protein [bacterium]